jgi:hypothetical protein
MIASGQRSSYNRAVPSDPPLTKRQLGLIILVAGVAVAAVTLAVNLLGLGHFNGFGPAKQMALAGAGAAILFGLSLFPLGDRPA